MSQLFLFLFLAAFPAEAHDSFQLAEWGSIIPVERMPGGYTLSVSTVPADRRLPLPVSLGQITRILRSDNKSASDALLQFNAEGTQSSLVLPQHFEKNQIAELILETAKQSGQLSDGRIVFLAADAEIVGTTARLDSQPVNTRIGFWTDPADFIQWKYQPTRPGKYSIDLTYSLAGGDGSVVELEIATKKISTRIAPTGSWFRYRTIAIGNVSLEGADSIRVISRCLEKTGPAAMNLKAIVLSPIPEGGPIVQSDDGVIVCHARDVTIRGVKVQYEPRPEKNTVGFWVIPEDRVQWEFEVTMPGRFDVEILQGCGQGQGGSQVDLFVGRQQLRFEVEDTGHFQNFKPRMIGSVVIEKGGRQTLLVVPVKKPGVAVMDLRQVRLIPSTK